MAQTVKNPTAMREVPVQSPGWEDSPGEGRGYPLQYSCLENPHGQRSLVDFSPWGRKESDTPERLSTAHKVIILGVIAFKSVDRVKQIDCHHRDESHPQLKALRENLDALGEKEFCLHTAFRLKTI